MLDFRVLKSKEYSFFIDDELCELTIEKKGDHFFYSFEFNRKADTPLNRAIKKNPCNFNFYVKEEQVEQIREFVEDKERIKVEPLYKMPSNAYNCWIGIDTHLFSKYLYYYEGYCCCCLLVLVVVLSPCSPERVF